MASRHAKHFVITLDNGRLLVSRAREIVPNFRYEIVHIPSSLLEWLWPIQNPSPHAMWAPTTATRELREASLKKQGIGLGEKME